MYIKLKTVKAHEKMLAKESMKQEFDTLAENFGKHDFPVQRGTINSIILGMDYINVEKKINVALVLANAMERPVREIHAVLKVMLSEPDAKVAVVTINFDTDFMGELAFGEGIFVYVGIPVMGLKKDQHFSAREYSANLSDVRVTFAEANEPADDSANNQ